MIGDGKQFEVRGVEADFGWSGLSCGSFLFSCVDSVVGLKKKKYLYKFL
jgi:hypothetical protein